MRWQDDTGINRFTLEPIVGTPGFWLATACHAGTAVAVRLSSEAVAQLAVALLPVALRAQAIEPPPAPIPPFPWDRLLVQSVSGTWHVCSTLDPDGDLIEAPPGFLPRFSRTGCDKLVKPMGYGDPVVPEGQKACRDCDWATPTPSSTGAGSQECDCSTYEPRWYTP